MSKYFVQVEGRKTGPFEMPSLLFMVQNGQLKPLDSVSLNGLEWRPARLIPELFPPDSQLGRLAPSGLASGGSRFVSLPADQNAGLLDRVLPIAAVAVASLLFGLILGWFFMKQENAGVASLESDLAQLQKEKEKFLLREKDLVSREHFEKMGKVTKEKHDLRLEELSTELKTADAAMTAQKAESKQKLDQSVDAGKRLITRLEEIEKEILPIKKLVALLEKNESLRETLEEIQNLSEKDLGSALLGIKKTLGGRNDGLAIEARGNYRLLLTKPSPSPSLYATVARWAEISSIVRQIVVVHHLSETARVTGSELKSGKDLQGLFILRILKKETKTKELEIKIGKEKGAEEAREKANAALEEAVQNSEAILLKLGLNEETLAKEFDLQNKGMKKKLLDEIRRELERLDRIYRNESPKKIENHLPGLEGVSYRATEFIYRFYGAPELDELTALLEGYQIYKVLTSELDTIERRRLLISKWEKIQKGSAPLSAKTIAEKIERFSLEREIARFAGVIPGMGE